MTHLLRLQDACFDEPGHGSIEDADLVVDGGELVFAQGGEGAGKTVLARGALGFVTATAGEVELFGHAVAGLVHDELLALRGRCAFSSSSAPLLANQSLRDNLALPLLMRGQSARAIDAVVDDILARFDLAPVAMVRPDDLLPRDRDLARTARALALPAELFVLDDPTLPSAARALLLEKINAGAGALVIGRKAGAFPEATRVITLRSPGSAVGAYAFGARAPLGPT